MTPPLALPSTTDLRPTVAGRWRPLALRPPRASADQRVEVDAGNTAAFGLLLLATGDLLFRPADLIAGLSGLPVHKLLLVPCALLAMPRLVHTLKPQALRRGPITLSLVLMVVAVVMSHLSHGDSYDARVGGIEMAKTCLFAVLVLALVDSLERVRLMLWTMTAAVTLTACLALAQRHGVLHLSALSQVEQSVLGADKHATVTRLCGIGVFHDPNDFALVIVLAMTVCAGTLWPCRDALGRCLMLPPLAILGYALFLTQSRGGALSAAAALATLVALRLGLRNALLLAIPLGALLLGPLSVRSLNLDNPSDTFQTRLRLWDRSLDAFLGSPLFGIGQGKLVESLGQVAHNSFLHAFAELGVVGGTLFLGSFCVLAHALLRLAPATPGLARLRPGLLAGTVGYAAGLLSLSRCYIAPTYLVLALGAAFVGVGWRTSGQETARLRARTVCLAAAAFLIAIGVCVRLMLMEVGP